MLQGSPEETRIMKPGLTSLKEILKQNKMKFAE